MSTNEEILKRLAALEAENAKLKSQVGSAGPPVKPTMTYVTTYKGHPLLRFEGNFRPFGLGLKKCSLVLERLEDVRYFVESNKNLLASAPEIEAE